ncbi:hypothetical protein GVAV_003173 [Gurleya vavrai]
MIFFLFQLSFQKSVVFHNKAFTCHIDYPAPSDILGIVKISPVYDLGQADFEIIDSEVPDRKYIRYRDNPKYALGVINSSSNEVKNKMHLTRLAFHKGLTNLQFEIVKRKKCLNIIFDGKCAFWDVKEYNISFKECTGNDEECFFTTFIDKIIR